MKPNCSYKSILEDLHYSLKKETVLKQMINDFSQVTWANIEILDWQTNDNKLPIEYYFYDSFFGKVLAANTCKGVCYLGLIEGKPDKVLEDLKKRFKHTILQETETRQQKQALDFLNGETDRHLKLHLKGTPYQTGIWRKLLQIPYGKVISYATLGGSIRYARAAGTANGRNPVFYIIPCHRVVNTSGEFDRYFWGKNVKKQLLAWEFANTSI